MTYKQDLYKAKESEIDDLFLEYLVPVMKYLEHLELIEEQVQNFDAASYETSLHKDKKLPSMKKKMYRNDKTEYWPKSIMESLN